MTRELRPADEAAIFSLFEAMPMEAGDIRLTYDRTPEFSRLLRCQAERYRTYVGTRDERLLGFGSLSWGPRYVAGKKETVAYLGDLRVVFDRAAARGWRGFYGDLVERVLNSSEFGPSAYLYTGILKENAAAMRSLVANRRYPSRFEYRFLKEVRMVNVIFRKPWKAKETLPFGWTVVAGPREDELRLFLDRCQREKLFGYCFDGSPDDELSRRLKSWPGAELSRFLAIRNSRGEIVACCLPWSPGAAKRMRVAQAAPLTRVALSGLSMMGLQTPRVGKDLETLYLTHLSFSGSLEYGEKALAVGLFLEEILERGWNEGYHLISYCDEEGLSRLHDRFFFLTTDVHLFEVGRAGSPVTLGVPRSIGFEMALV